MCADNKKAEVVAMPKPSPAMNLHGTQSPAAAASSASLHPRPCERCQPMPRQCVCLKVPRTVEQERSAYQIASRHAGIWADAEVIDQEGEESPEPVQEKDMWACPRCKSLNSRHELLCQVKVDERKWDGARGDGACGLGSSKLDP